MKKYFIFIFVLLAQFNFAGINVNTQANNKVISIITFKNTTNNANFNWLTEAISDSITVDIAKLDVLKVVERADLKKIIIEQQLSNSNLADPNYAIKVGKLLSAQLILTGDFILVGNELRINAKIINVERGNIVSAYAVNGDKSKLFNMCRKIIIELMSRMNIALDEERLKILGDATVPTINMQAVEANYNGVLQVDKGNNVEAVKFFKNAMTIDSEYTASIDNFVNINFQTNQLNSLFANQWEKMKYFDLIFPRLWEILEKTIIKNIEILPYKLTVIDENNGLLSFNFKVNFNVPAFNIFFNKLKLIQLDSTIFGSFQFGDIKFYLTRKIADFLKSNPNLIVKDILNFRFNNSTLISLPFDIKIPFFGSGDFSRRAIKLDYKQVKFIISEESLGTDDSKLYSISGVFTKKQFENLQKIEILKFTPTSVLSEGNYNKTVILNELIGKWKYTIYHGNNYRPTFGELVINPDNTYSLKRNDVIKNGTYTFEDNLLNLYYNLDRREYRLIYLVRKNNVGEIEIEFQFKDSQNNDCYEITTLYRD